MSPQRQKGTAAETAVVRWLRDHGFPNVDRAPARGRDDRGDIDGIPGVVLEVKNHRAADLSGWMGELAAEMSNAAAPVGAVVHKRRGTTDVGDWYVTMPMRVFARFLAEWDQA